jgi:hypothetical protein
LGGRKTFPSGRSFKDPSVIWCGGEGRLFGAIRSEKRSHPVEYLSDHDWSEANGPPRHILALINDHFCAPGGPFLHPAEALVPDPAGD